jgi:hypothetical protein
LTAVGIQIFNFAHFAAFPSVNKVLSKYYHQVTANDKNVMLRLFMATVISMAYSEKII